MYQHDLSEKILDEKLSLTSIDAVAEVGVELNTCSGEILAKVPSLSSKLCEKIIKARPLKSRSDLLKISGLGKQTYKNCAAFVRVSPGSGGGSEEELDATLVHPESYDLARWLLKELQWKLSDASSIKVTTNEQQKKEWSVIAKKASNIFEVTPDRCLTVIDHLFFSITSPDPRLRESAELKKTVPLGSATGCSSLPHDASTIDKLRESKLPLRNIRATVRNVVDFGAFVDFGLEQNGLLHRSKIGHIQLGSLMVGQEIGIDILGVASNKISVGLAGLDLPADNRDNQNKKRQLKPAAKKSSGKKLRSER